MNLRSEDGERQQIHPVTLNVDSSDPPAACGKYDPRPSVQSGIDIERIRTRSEK